MLRFIPLYDTSHLTLTFPLTTLLCSLLWRHNGHDSVSNHQPCGCLLNRLFRRRSKKTSKLRVTGLCAGNSPGPVNSPHKWPVTRKMFPFDDVIMFMHRFCFMNAWEISRRLNATHSDVSFIHWYAYSALCIDPLWVIIYLITGTPQTR